MEETNTVETTVVKEVLTQTSSADLDQEAFDTLAAAVFSSEKAFEELVELLQDWDSVSKSLGSKGLADVLQGYCLYLKGDLEAAEEVFRAQKRNEWATYYLARTLSGRNHAEEAVKAGEELQEKHSSILPFTCLMVELLSKAGRTEEAQKLLDNLKKAEGGSVQFLLHTGYCLERTGEYAAAIQQYRQVLAKDQHNAEAYFRLGYLLDLYGTDADEANDEAVSAYESCVRLSPAYTNAVLNLGLLYEDRERYHDAVKCYESVLRRFPNHERALLFLGDAHASTRMFYDKDQEKKADKHSQVLKIPVSDFELSVRSRNCLQKMNIMTLGDLIMKTEQELLAYKNFGETSLSEIKEMLTQKGLRLGQGLENKAGDVPAGRNPLEATASQEVLQKPIEELELSVRSRRCMERLEVRSVRDLINKTEVELMSAKNFGMTSLNEIKKKLTEMGLSLRS